MPDKFVSKIITPFGERKIKAEAVTDDVKNALKEFVVFDYGAATFEDISSAIGQNKNVVLSDATGFVSNYAHLQHFVPLGSSTFVNVYDGNVITYTINLDGTKTKTTLPIESSSVEFISFSTTFAQVGAILTAGKLPILVDETIEDSPYYYNLIYDNDGLEYIFSNLSGTVNRTYKLSGSGWGALSSISFENASNKVTTWSATPSNTKYPSEKLVFDSLKMKDNGSKIESDIVNGKFTIDGQNSTTKLTLTSVSTLIIVSNVGVPNFAITIDNSANASDVSISVKTSDELTTLYHSTAGGTSIAAGSIVQITAVGDCWTLAEFTVPTP